MFPILLKQHKYTQWADISGGQHAVMDGVSMKSIWDPEVQILISLGNKKQLSASIISVTS